MIKYIKSNVPANIIKPLLSRYIKININLIDNNYKLNTILNNYNIRLKDILIIISNNIVINKCKDNLYQIYIRDISINNYRLNNFLELLEYGNLEITAPKIISKLFSISLKQLKNYLGGL